MKTCKVISFCLVFLFLNFLVKAQNINEKTIELKSLIKETIIKKCHLTELSNDKDVQIDNNMITIGINFDNESLGSFWSPEVAIQYIFDASLSNVLNTIWDVNSNKYKIFKKIKFNVDIKPKNIPPLITLEIQLKDWEAYKSGGKKEILYKNMNISAEGIPFKFDAHVAVDIE